MFTLTPAAASRILASAEQIGANGMALRIAAKLDDAGKMVFGLGFDEVREQDVSLESEGLTVIIAPPSRPLLQGMILDFVEIEPGDWQFAFFRADIPGDCPPSDCGDCGSRAGCASGR